MANSKFQDLHPDGYYKVKVIGNTVGEGKNSGLPYFKLKVEVLEKSGKGPKGDFAPGAHRYIYLNLSEFSFPVTEAILQAAGVNTRDEEALERLNGDHPNHHDLTGFEFFARNKPQEWNGKLSDNFSPSKNWEVRSPNSWMNNITKPSTAAKAQLANMFGATRKMQTRATQVRPAYARPSFDTSDVPF